MQQHAPSFPIDIAEARTAHVPIFLKGIGTLVASAQILVRPQVSGTIIDVFYEEGHYVQTGELLMILDSRLYEANLKIAKAGLNSDEADYRLNYNITRRMSNLVGEDYVSEIEYEKSLAKLEAAHASIAKTIAEIKKAEVDLSYTRLYSPINGYIGEHYYTAGNFVTLNDKDPLTIINQITPIYVNFYLPSSYLEQIRAAQKQAPLFLKAERPSDTEHPLEGKLTFIDNTINAKTGMILLKGLIANKDERGWPGEFVRVHLLVKTLQDAVVVPTEALVLGQDSDFIYVVDKEKMTVEIRTVKIRMEFENMTVIESGVEVNEIVVVDGQLNLSQGAKVHIPKEKVE